VPSYTIDGLELQSGGGGKDAARSFYQRFNPLIERRLEVAAEANLKLDATLENGVVKVVAQVALDKVSDMGTAYKLHVLLVEETLRYQGENGIRLHSAVVRAAGGFMAGGFTLDQAKIEQAKGETVNASFDIASISAALKKNADEFEASWSKERDEPFTFSERKHEINANNLSVVAFVQDQKSRKVLQAATARLHGKGVAMR
jgi:hypothetical protein